jgi:putative flavoprotein involved in K+ transport
LLKQSQYAGFMNNEKEFREGGSMSEKVNTVVIGAGQAGLSVGYHLAQRGLRFVILDANQRVGDSWRNRWDSLRLFTPARYDGLAGMPYPAAPHYFPTKDEFADYLEAYAAHFQLPVQTGVRVERLYRNGEQLIVETGRQRYEADNVVVAMANYQQPWQPAFAAQLQPGITQLHSAEYRNPSQLQKGPVLIVGAGNSGSELAMEIARHHPVFMSGRSTGELPFRIQGTAARLFLSSLLLRFIFHRVLTVDTPPGRKIRPKLITGGGPLIRVKYRDLAAAGVERVPKTVRVKDGLPVLEDGRVLSVTNVIWCTGFRPGFRWIELPVLGEHEPMHERGVVGSQPGLFFVGLHFQYGFSSSMIHGVGRDAAFIAAQIASRRSAQRSSVNTNPEAVLALDNSPAGTADQ